MKLKVIIIDDEPDAIDALESIININELEYELVAKTTNPLDAIGLIKEHEPDVVFLDIEMPQLNGFQLLESLSEINFEVIFVTAYENYAIKAIKENAIDYILKPVNIPEVLGALEKVRKKRLKEHKTKSNYNKLLKDIDTHRFNKLRIATSNGFELIDVDDLISLEADGSYTTAVFKNRDNLIISKSIRHVESLLDTNLFFRVHRTFIVNITHVIRFDRDNYSLTMCNNQVIPVSTRRYNTFVTFLETQEE